MAYGGWVFCITFLFLLWLRPFFPPTVSSYWVVGWVFLRQGADKVILKLVTACLLALFYKVPQVPWVGCWVFFALSNKVDQQHFIAWFSCLSYQKRETLCCFAERESAVFDFWRSRNGISASFAATSPSTGHLIFPWRSTTSAVGFCLCSLSFIEQISLVNCVGMEW